MQNKENNKKLKKTVITTLTALLLAALVFFCVFGVVRRVARNNAYKVETLSQQQISAVRTNKKATKLMIVAHPDDDALWGGAHLLSGDYFVVCITNGNNPTRKAEFEAMLEKSGNSGYILDYPDKILGKRDDWKEVWDKISYDIENIMLCKDWKLIVTHNINGEYGHQHHKYSHSIVTEIYDRNRIFSPLYCFGKYYKKSALRDNQDGLTALSAKELGGKKELIELYSSQSKVTNKLIHMAPYEEWTKYERLSEHEEYRK